MRNRGTFGNIRPTGVCGRSGGDELRGVQAGVHPGDTARFAQRRLSVQSRGDSHLKP